MEGAVVHRVVSENAIRQGQGREDVKHKLTELVLAKVGDLAGESDPLTDAPLDSLAFAELTTEIETEFQIRLAEDVLDCRTVDELADLVRSRLQAPVAQRSR